MNDNLYVSIELINDGMKFKSTVEGKPEIITDYIPPYGDGRSVLPLELFLSSLGSCLGGALSQILRKMRKQVDGLAISVQGSRRSEHPTCFESINLAIDLKSQDASVDDLRKALSLSEGICPVWAMIDNKVAMEFTLNVSN